MPKKVDAGRANVRIGIDDQFTQALKRAQRKLKNFAGGVSAMGKKIAIGGAAIAAPLAASVGVFADYGDKLHKMSARTGIAVESLSELGFAAEQSGANLDAVGKAVLKMNRRVGRLTVGAGSQSQVDAIEELGLSIEQLSAMNPEQRFLAIGDAIASYGDDSAAAGLAQRAFGTEIDKLLPLILEGKDAIEGMRQRARDLGRQFSSEDAEDAAKLTDAWNELKSVGESLAMTLGAALAPSATDVTDAITNGASTVADFIRNNQGLVTFAAAAAGGLLALGAAFVVVGMGASGLASIIGLVSGAFTMLTGAASAAWAAVTGPLAPIAAIAAGILLPMGAALAYVTAKAGIYADVWDYVSAQLKKFWGIAKETFGGIAAALTAGEYLMAAKILWAGLKVAFYTGLSEIGSLLDGAFAKWWDGFKRFGKTLLQTAWDVFKAIPKLLWRALSGGSIAGAMAEIFQNTADGLGDRIDANLAESKRELAKLKSEAEKLRDKRSKGLAGVPDDDGLRDGLGGDDAPAGPEPPDPTEETQKRIDSIREEIATLRRGRDAMKRYKLAQMGATEAQLRALKAAEAAREKAKAEEDVRKKIASLRKEAAELRYGQEAAERYRLAQRGATEAQLEALKAAQATRDKARKAKELEDEAERLNEAVRSPMEVFRDEVRQLRQLRKFGLSDEAFREQFDQAKKQLRESRETTDEATTKITNRGTFSGFNAGRLGGRDRDQERIAESTEQVAENTRRAAEALEDFEPQRLSR